MTPTQLVLASVTLGVVAGVLFTTLVFTARTLGKRRAANLRPILPSAAKDILKDLPIFAVVLDASLSPIYANPIARDDPRISGEQLRDEDFLRRARRVMQTGVTDVRDPDQNDIEDTVRVKIVRMESKFLVVFAEDLGEEQRLNTMRRDFIANMSHEMKTPVAALSLLAEAVLEAADEPELVRGFATSMSKETKRIRNLSRDVIQLSEAQSTLRAEDREPVDLLGVLHTELEAHEEFANLRHVSLLLHNNCDRETHAVTLGRSSAIATVIANLLTNAIRHSPEFSSVGVTLSEEDQTFKITVTDQGEGIEPEHLPRIFERFYRIDTSRNRAEGGGTGLGLAIARHTMRSHGGDIDVWSQPGIGSSFTLTFSKYQEESKRKTKTRSAKPKRSKQPKSQNA